MVRLEKLLRRIGRHPSQADIGKVDPRGPVFVSYRISDGFDLAANTAWALRAAGVPVWHDESDLPPGDTERRLAEALESGLSGAVLLVTPEIEHSRIVREIELPQLLQLAENPAFTLSVLSVIEREPEKLDYGAPDRLLAQPEGTLENFKQKPARTQRQRADAAHAQCQRRMQAVRSNVGAASGVITLDVQTRIPPFATRVDSDLVLRLRPPMDGDRRPHYQGLHDLKLFLSDLPQLVALAGAEHAKMRGGAHLSVAYALGAALPHDTHWAHRGRRHHWRYMVAHRQRARTGWVKQIVGCRVLTRFCIINWGDSRVHRPASDTERLRFRRPRGRGW